MLAYKIPPPFSVYMRLLERTGPFDAYSA
jgi:hypothetical protein